MAGTERMIHLPHRLIVVCGRDWRSEPDLVVRGGGGRSQGEQLNRDRIEAAGGNRVIREVRVRSQRIVYGSHAAGCEPFRKIAPLHGGIRSGADRARRRGTNPGALIGTEEKSPVFVDRTACRAAELITFQAVAAGEKIG